MTQIPDVDKAYNDFLDEVGIESILKHYSPSRVLKEIDPTAYNVGQADWLSSEDIHQCDACEEYFDDEDDLANGKCEGCRDYLAGYDDQGGD